MRTSSLPLLCCLAWSGMLVGCGSEAGDNTASSPLPVRFGAISLVLDGAFAPYLAERTAVAPDTVGGFPADVLCVSQVMRQEDKQAIAQAAALEFPFSGWVPTDLDSQPDDPRTQDGSVPALPTTPPCGTADLSTKADAVLDCIKAQCSTVPGSEEGRMSEGSCAVQKCTGSFSQLLFGNSDSKRCFSCLLYTGMSERIKDIRSACENDARAGFTFQGGNGLLILSRFPLSDVRAWVLPSTSWREILLSATLSPPGVSPVDVHCLTLQGPHSSATQPYTGVYANGATGDDAWFAESKLQAQRVVEHLSAQSGARPTVIWGDYYVGPDVTGEDGPPLTGVVPEAFSILAGAFREAVSQGYAPVCTTCGENPINGGRADLPGAWTAHVQTLNVPTDAVASTSRFGEDLIAHGDKPDTSPAQTIAIPVSPRYGLVSTIVLH